MEGTQSVISGLIVMSVQFGTVPAWELGVVLNLSEDPQT